MATRRERVIFDATDRLSPAMAKMAATAKVLDHELDGIGATSSSTARDMDSGGKAIDRYSGRLSILLSAVAAVGPALVPVGASTVQVLSGVASQAGFAAVGVGSMLVAFQGVGDALKAVNTAALEPTSANLEKAREAMADLSPAAQDMVTQLHNMIPALKGMRDVAAENMMPGLAEGLDQMMTAAPRVADMLGRVSGGMGDLFANIGGSVASGRWDEFIDFIGAEAPRAIGELGTATGNTIHALAELWMAMTPANADWSRGLVEATASFDKWAAGVSQTKGFQEFLTYMDSMGPKVWSTLGSIGNAFLQIAEAAAPLGGPTLAALEAFADVIAMIADSPLGTPLLALAQLAAVGKLLGASFGAASAGVARFTTSTAASTTMLGRASVGLRQMRADVAVLGSTWATAGARSQREQARMVAAQGRLASSGLKAGAGVAAFALAMSPLPEKVGMTNTAMGAMLGMMAGPWGAAAGAAVGGTLDLVSATKDLGRSLEQASDAGARAAGGSLSQMEAAYKKMAAASKEAAKAQDDSLLHMISPISTVPGLLNKGKTDELRRDMIDLGGQINAARANAGLQLLSAGLSRTATGAREASMSMSQFRGVLDQVSGAISRMQAIDNMQSALNEMGRTLRESGGKWQGTSDKMIAVRASMNQVGTAAVAVADKMEDAGKASAYLGKARQRFIQTATAAGMSRKAAAAYANQLKLIPRTVDSKIKINAGAAMGVLVGIRSQLSAIQSKTITVTVRRSVAGAMAGAGMATGGYVSGPGGPRDDAIPAWLSNGEFVMNAAATKRLRPWLEAENARGYADGGYVSDGIEDAEYFANGGRVKKRKGKRGRRNRGLEALRAASDAAAANLDAMTASLDGVRSTADGLAGAIRDGLTRSVSDIMSGNPWVSSGDRSSGIFSGLRADIAKANLTRSLGAQLAAGGVKGDALASLYEAGPVGMQAIVGLGASGMAQYQALFNERAALAAAASGAGSNQAYGAQTAVLQAEVNRLTVVAKQAEKAVDVAKGSAKAMREGNQKASKQAAHKRKQRAGRR